MQLPTPSSEQLIATVLFACAVLHTFSSSALQKVASKCPDGSIAENFFHLIGEVEVVFGLWAGILIGVMALVSGGESAIHYAEHLNFTEPLFVFAIMTVAATRPIIELATRIIKSHGTVFSLGLGISPNITVYACCLIIGPVLGSLITEPAAMTVTALILKDLYFDRETSLRFKYGTLAALFVNISIGGVLTHFAAPPVLMVASKWNWDTAYMFEHFGWRALIATTLNACLASALFRNELKTLPTTTPSTTSSAPYWLTITHLVFLTLIVLTAHHAVIFIGLLLFFIGVAAMTREHQDELKIRESLLVAFFLGGLVVLGGLQSWWLDPLIRSLDTTPLFLGATALTAITDNAALTYLGSQVPDISVAFKHALISGAVAGGGLTVIANAPNPAGYSILQTSFGPEGISPLKLLLAALLPTLIAMACFWLI